MKKRILCLLLCLCTLMALMPATALAGYRYSIKTMDVTIEAPTAGMTRTEGAALQLLSVQTEYGELVSTGGAMLVGQIVWDGEFDRDNNWAFMAGMTYTATIQINLSYEQGYWVNHKSDGAGNDVMDSNYVKLTVNGVPTEITMGTAANPKFKVNITIPAEEQSDEEKDAAEAEHLARHAERHESERAFVEPYTTAEANALWVEKQAYDTIILNEATLPEPLLDDGYMYDEIIDESLSKDYVTGLLMDFSLDFFANEEQQENFVLSLTGSQYPNLKEIWLGDKVDAVWFLKALKESTEGRYHGGETWYWTHSGSFNTGNATLYISGAAAEAVRAAYDDEIRVGGIAPCFSIKVYDGDVYAAQKAGTAAAKDYCSDHEYTKVIMATDRVAHLSDCTAGLRWYYSCNLCGKCEYNDSHTISRSYSYSQEVPKAYHDYSLKFATEEAYVGVNAAGDQVFFLSCFYCGKPYNYYAPDTTLGTDALKYTDAKPYMFTISAKSDAKMSTWAQSDVNFALDNNLIDTALLGGDYTKAISRLQFCSVAVRLAEELTGGEIAAAPSGTFKDTDNLYVRKAYAAGITTGVSETAFDPNGTLTRQQMATFLYRTLQYVEANSDYRYTDYSSKLSTYSDSSQIKSWAKEAMAFMNALDLIKGTSATTLAPNATCTIEQAVAVAYRSIYAHLIGWYQAAEDTEYGYSFVTLEKGDRVWISGGYIGSNIKSASGKYTFDCSFALEEPFSGETCCIKVSALKPIRD